MIVDLLSESESRIERSFKSSFSSLHISSGSLMPAINTLFNYAEI